MLNKLVRFWLNHTCLWLGPYNKKGSTLFISPKRRNSQNSVNVGGVLMRKFFEKKKKTQCMAFGIWGKAIPILSSTFYRCQMSESHCRSHGLLQYHSLGVTQGRVTLSLVPGSYSASSNGHWPPSTLFCSVYTTFSSRLSTPAVLCCRLDNLSFV